MSASYFSNRLDPIKIVNGTTNSRAVLAQEYQDAFLLGLLSPASFGGQTMTIQVNDKDDASGTWVNYMDATGTAVKVPAVSTAQIIPGIGAFPAFRIQASGNVNTDVIFLATKQSAA